MTRRPSLAILIIVSGAFFLLGLYSVFLQGGGSKGEATPTKASSSAVATTIPATSDQTTILVLGVDSLEAKAPSLRAIWYITYRLPAKDVFLLGAAADIPVQGRPGTAMKAVFGWSPENGVSPSFLEDLRRTIPLSFDALVVMDDKGFAAAVDFLGGVTVNGTEFSGQQVLDILSLTSDDPKGELATQKRVLEALSAKAGDLGDTPDLTPLVSLVPEHIYLTKPLGQIVALISPVLPIHSETTHIDLY